MRYVKPKRNHEDNIKTELAGWARKSGVHLHFEYTHKNCRFDAVAIRGSSVLAIVEIKNWENQKAFKAKQEPTEQLEKYLKHDVPVLVLWSFNGMKGMVKKLREYAVAFDKGRYRPKSSLIFYPKPSRPVEVSELDSLIKDQTSCMKYNTRWN